MHESQMYFLHQNKHPNFISHSLSEIPLYSGPLPASGLVLGSSSSLKFPGLRTSGVRRTLISVQVEELVDPDMQLGQNLSEWISRNNLSGRKQ